MPTLRITKLVCTLSALVSLVNCGGGANTSPPLPALSIATTSLPDGMVAFDYSQSIHASGGLAPFVWSVSSGSLPHNLSLGSSSTNTANLSGIPDTTQVATFALQLKDAKNQTAEQAYTLNINSTGLAQLQAVSGQVLPGTIVIQGVSAGPFIPTSWQQDTLNWVPDVRMPMFAAQTTGQYQNIYAPWPLEQANGWRMFYGGWDGQDVPFDEIHSAVTSDILSFGPRDLIITHGDFLNVNNVNVQQLPDGSLHMICTGGQLGNIDTFPVYFSSPDGMTWNGTPEPYSAKLTDIINIQGYTGFSTGYFNGANVLLRDGATWVLYFKDWNDFHTTYRATSGTLPTFQFQGVALKSDDLVNDVKKFTVNETNWYLMGLHFNGQLLLYSLSNDGVSFRPDASLFVILFLTSYLAGAQTPPDTPSGANTASPVTKTAATLRADMRKLWTDHVVWTRNFIIAAVGDQPDEKAATDRLLKNQEDIGDAVAAYYGSAAGEKLTALLKQHILIAADLVKAAKAHAQDKQSDPDRRWQKNAEDIADFLSQANPNWPKSTLLDLLKTHLSTTTSEVVARLSKDWDGDVEAFDAVYNHILKMSDALSDGIIKQFPDKFSARATDVLHSQETSARRALSNGGIYER
jgi:hypothetical protein